MKLEHNKIHKESRPKRKMPTSKIERSQTNNLMMYLKALKG